MKTRSKKSRILTALICLLAVAALAGMAALGALLVKHTGSQNWKNPSDIRAIELDSLWSDLFTQKHSRDEAEEHIGNILDRVEKLGGNTVLLTGRLGEDALFRGKKSEDMPKPGLYVQENDRFLNQYDPMELLLNQARDRNIRVILLATDKFGTQLFDESEAPEWLQKVARRYHTPLYSPMSQQVSTGARLYCCYDEDFPDLLRMDGAPGTLSAVYQNNPGCGLILGSLGGIEADPEPVLLLQTYLSDPEPLPQLMEKPVPATLSIVTPNPGVRVWGDQIYLLGTSNPTGGKVTVNGSPVGYQGSRGVWGVLLPLVDGQNNFSAVQDGETVTVTVQKGGGGSGGGSGGGKPQSDGSVPAEWAQKLRVTSPLTSLLDDPNDSDSIRMTCYEGAVAEVAHSKLITRNGKKTYAYQLQNGGYILSRDCELLPPGTSNAAFTGAVHETVGRDETITFKGLGTPLYTHSWEDDTLKLDFYSTDFMGELPVNFGFGGATVQAETFEHGLTLTFRFNQVDPLWGYHVDYTPEGGTRIVLKHQPRRSDDPAKPLTGVTVLLDPGHGDTDTGAIGSVSPDFPQEKEMNLAEARAAQHRLEQLGATVLMTRTDDSFPTLGDRLKMLNETRPDFFISLHHNSHNLNEDLGDLVGTECYWFYTEGKPLSENLVRRICEASGRPARGSFFNYFYVTRSNLCPAVLLETGFVCSPRDYEISTDNQVLWAEGGAIAQAILDSIPE